jgi:hypothetical protein
MGGRRTGGRWPVRRSRGIALPVAARHALLSITCGSRLGETSQKIAGDGACSPDEHGLVELAAPLTAELLSALRLVSKPADDAGGRPALPQRLADFRGGGTEVLVIGDDDHVEAAAGPATLAQRGHDRVGTTAQPDHLTQRGPGQQNHRRCLGEQVVYRTIDPNPPAVGDHVGLRHSSEQPAYRSPEQLQARALFGVAYTGENVESAVQLLGVLPYLVRLQAAACGHGQAQQSPARVEPTAVGCRQPVHQIPAGRVALGQQDRPGPDRRQRHRRGGNPWRALVRGYRDQCHRSARRA